MAYDEFFQGLQQLLNGADTFVNEGILPRSQSLGELLGIAGTLVLIGGVMFILLRYLVTGRMRKVRF